MLLFNPFKVFFSVGSIHTKKNSSWCQLINDKIINDSSIFTAKGSIDSFSDGRIFDVIWKEIIDEIFCFIAFYKKLTHMADINNTCVLPYGKDFIFYRSVLAGHFPTCKRGHFSASFYMFFIKFSSKQSHFLSLYYFCASVAEIRFSIKLTTVIGPTPPGTGEMASTTSITSL